MSRSSAALAAALVLACTMVVAAQTLRVMTIVQKDRAFSVSEISISKSDTIRFSNHDGFLHQLFVHSEAFNFDSDEQLPGQDVDLPFPVSGQYRVLCAIHPKMSLIVDVR